MPLYSPTYVLPSPPNDKIRDKMDELADRRLPWHTIHGARPPKWSARVARWRMRDWIYMHPEDDQVLILLGRRAWDSLGLPFDIGWMEWYGVAWHRHPMVAFPHPSRWFDAATDHLRAIASGELPRFEKGE